jgi:RNA polymerase-binding transcription factor DksA
MDTPQASRSTAQVREWLRARAAQLEQEIAAVRERSSTPRPEVSDRSGDSAVLQFGETGEAEMARDRAELRQIRLAAERLEQGRYGLCSDCDAAIDPRRLQAQPMATRCAACQALAERG